MPAPVSILETPRELGSHIGDSINAMAQEQLASDRDPAAEDAVLERYEQRLRERWGGQFDANVAACLRSCGRGLHSPQLRQMVEQHRTPWHERRES